MIFKAQINTFTVRREGETVILIYNGRRVCDLTWQAADELAAAWPGAGGMCVPPTMTWVLMRYSRQPAFWKSMAIN